MHRSYDTDMWCLVTGQDNSSTYYYRCMQEVHLGQDLGVLGCEHEQLCLGGDQLDLELFTLQLRKLEEGLQTTHRTGN